MKPIYFKSGFWNCKIASTKASLKTTSERYDYLIFIFFLLCCLACSKSNREVTRIKSEKIHIQKSVETISIQKGKQKILDYQTTTLKPEFEAPKYYNRSGFIRKVFSPSGQTLTDDFPFGHTHQHAVFFAWVNTSYKGEKVDFWNQQSETGTVKHHEIISTTETDSTASFQVELQHLSLKHGPILKEKWSVTAFDRSENYLVWDIQSIQENITSDTLFINEYHYGGLGIRGTKHWNSADSFAFQNHMKVLTSENHDRTNSNHANPIWVAMYGGINGKTCGLAVIDHPSNFRYPQPIRVHPEIPYFCKAPMVGEAFYLVTGKPYFSNYRLITFDGLPPIELINREAQNFSK